MINTPKIYKMRIVFCWMKGTPPASTFGVVRKMVLASGLPFEPAKINNRWPRLAYGPACAQGQRAAREYVDIYLRQACAAQDVREALAQVAPAELELLEVTRVPYPLPSVQNLAAAICYRVKDNADVFSAASQPLEDWARNSSLAVTLRGQNGLVCQKDLKVGVLAVRTVSADEIALTLGKINGQWPDPQWVVAAWLGIEIPLQQETFAIAGLTFIRQEICWQDSQGAFHAI